MDELDLVRLARPEAPEPDVAALRAAAMGDLLAPPAGDGAPIGGGTPPEHRADDDLIPLLDGGRGERATDRPRARRPWRLAFAGVAAAAILAAGLALVLQRDRDQGGVATTLEDNVLRGALQGWWSQTWEVTSERGEIRWGALSVSFQASRDGAVTFDGPCGIFVSRRYRVEDARLVLSEPLTSAEGFCRTDRDLGDVSTSIVGLLSSRPALAVDGDTLTVGESVFHRLDGDPLVPTTQAAQPTTVADAADPRFERLAGRRFALQGLTDGTGANPRAPQRYVAVRFPTGRIDLSGCVVADGLASAPDGVLTITSFTTTTAGCGDPVVDEFRTLLLARPHLSGDGDVLVLRADDGTTAHLVAVAEDAATPPTTGAGFGRPQLTTVPPRVTTALPAVAPVPTMADLRGRNFVAANGALLRFDDVERRPAPLIGTTWTTSGRRAAQATGFAGYRATLRLDRGGTWALSGCGNERRGRYAVDGTTVTFTVGDVGTGAACESQPEADEARSLAQLITAGRLAFSVDDQSMRLTGPDGAGEMFVAAR